MSRTAVIAGATGLVGSRLLRQLVARRDYREVRVLGRRPPAQDAAKIRFVGTDFSDLAAHADALDADDVFCCLGTTLREAGSKAAFERVDYHMVVDLARAARKAGARRFFVVSAAGASLKSPVFYSRTKARMEKAVLDLPFEAVHVVRPALLLGPRTGQRRRLAELVAQKLAPLYAPLLRGPLRPYRPIRADDVASALVTLAVHGAPGAHVHSLPLAND